MVNPFVLDASAVLAYLQDEKGCENVHNVLSEGNAIISAVNYAEVIGKLFDAGLSESLVKTVIENLDLQIESMDTQQAWTTGELRLKTKGFGLSLGDRACLALALIKGLSVITADKQWGNLTLGTQIIQLR